MLPSIKAKVLKSVFPAILVLVTLIVCKQNYTRDTYLTGWDTLHPEFNFKLYWSRIIDGVWQEHQGLGAVASQAHASEIPRIIILQVFDFFLPTNQLRYAYAFLMLVLGPLGVYAFLYFCLLDRKSTLPRAMGAFLGGLFYLFNLGTVQHFYVPLEMFLTHYGFLGWVFLSASLYFQTGRKKHLVLFLLFSIFIIPQAHTSTLFYSYILLLTAYLGVFGISSVRDKGIKVSLSRFGIIILYTLSLNSFWLFPNLYFAVNHGREIQQSKIHMLFSEEAFLQNKAYGNINDVAIVKNFLFNWGEYVGSNQFGELLGEWRTHLLQKHVVNIGYALFIFVLLGGILGSIKKDTKIIGLLVGVLMLSVFFLLNVNPPLGFLFKWMQSNIPLFKEAFRFPFTKFSIGLILAYSCLFGYLLGNIYSSLEKFWTGRFVIYLIMSLFITLTFSGAIVYYAFPLIKGNLISSSMRVSIPSRYFNMFDFFSQQKLYGRVADFPIHSFWGWTYHSWDSRGLGYQGAGFLWFGIKQPLLNREFDRWNIINENYYREMTKAVYSEDAAAFEKVLNKYDIRWLLVDDSIIAPGVDPKVLFKEELQSIISSMSSIRMAQDFGQGLKVYEYTPTKNFSLVSETKEYYISNYSTYKEFTDPVYENYGDYVSIAENNYPGIGITNSDESVFDGLIEDKEDKYVLNFGKPDDSLYYKYFTIYGRRELNTLVLDITRPDGDPRSVLESRKVTLVVDKHPILKVNGSAVGISDMTKDEKLLEGVEMRKNETLNFDIQYAELKSISINDSHKVLESCSDYRGAAAYAIRYETNGFSLVGRNVDACVTAPLRQYIPEYAKDVVLTYKVASSGSTGMVCVFNSISGLCEGQNLSDGSYFVKISGDPDDYYLRFISNTLTSSSEESVRFFDIQIGESTLDSSFIINPLLSTGSSFVVVPKNEDKELADFVSSPRICNSGSTSFENSTVQKHPDGTITYDSTNESVCDSFHFPAISHKSGALLEIESRNISGMPLRVCVTNEITKRCDLYVSLGESSQYKKKFYIIPPLDEGTGYTVNISNLTFGNTRAVNELKYINMTELPYNYIKNMGTSPDKGTGTLIEYSEAYEPGWVAVCGWRLCPAEHVKVNNWSNGWVFEGTVDLSKIRMYFWPQALEYLGFILSGLSIASL